MRSVLSSGISVISGFFAPTTRSQRRAEIAAAFSEHAPFVYRVLHRLGADPNATDDLVQEVFVIAMRRWARYDPRAPVRPWLYGIARRVASHHRRSQRRMRGRDRTVAAMQAEPGLGQATRASPTPHQGLEAHLASEFIQSFCDSLSEPLREAFVCIELEGMSGPETSAALGVRLNTVYTRLRRARAAFADAVAAREALV